MLSYLGERGLKICNGNVNGMEEGEFTFIGKEETVIDYVLAGEKVRRMIKKMEVDREANSGNFSWIVGMFGGGNVDTSAGDRWGKKEKRIRMGK